MIHTWFTSDHHFGHSNILEYEKYARPFSCLEEMHEALIDNWNSVVRDGDIVYHLGDFCFGRQNIEIAGRLNGKKRLIMGNHDSYPSSDYLRYFDKLYGALFWKGCILTHVPVHPDQFGKRAALNLHGHLHSKKVKQIVNELFQMKLNDDRCPVTFMKPGWEEEDLNYFNVSVEQNNLIPFHADQILERLEVLKI